MKQWHASVTGRRTLGPALWRIQVAAPDPGTATHAGQFFLVAGPGYLRHPLFPARLTPEGYDFLVKAGADPVWAWLASRAPGDSLDLLGPLGRGFDVPTREQRLLLIAETAPDVGPLLPLVEPALAAGAPVTLLTGGLQASAVFPARELPAAVELRVTTADGSLGRRGGVATLFPEVLAWADRVCAAGSRDLYCALRSAVDQTRPMPASHFAQVLLRDIPLACGVGACLSCTLESERGPLLACIEGPVFDLRDLEGVLAP